MQRAWWNRGRGRGLTGSRPPLRLGVAVTIGSVALATAAIYPLKTAAPAVVAERRVPARRAARLGATGDCGSARRGAAERRRIQFLPPAAGRAVHDLRQPQLGRPGRVRAHRRRRQHDRRARARPRGRSRAAPPRGRPRRRRWRANCWWDADRAPRRARQRARRVARGTGHSLGGDRARPPPRAGRAARALALHDGPTAGRSRPCSCREQPRRRNSRASPLPGHSGARRTHRDCAAAATPSRRRQSRRPRCRRSDELKTALLAAISHDLRTPLTAIVAAGHALGAETMTPDERGRANGAVVEEGERLSALIDKLLDLSRLQAGRAEPRREWVSLEEVAARGPGCPAGVGGDVRMTRSIRDVPPSWPMPRSSSGCSRTCSRTRAATRTACPCRSHVRRSGARVDRPGRRPGSGDSPAEQERIFEPFYRGASPEQRRLDRRRSRAGDRQGVRSRRTTGRSRSSRSPGRAPVSSISFPPATTGRASA